MGFLDALQLPGKDDHDDDSSSSSSSNNSWISTGEGVEIMEDGSTSVSEKGNDNDNNKKTTKGTKSSKKWHWGHKHNFWSFGSSSDNDKEKETNQSRHVAGIDDGTSSDNKNKTKDEDNKKNKKESSWTSFFSGIASDNNNDEKSDEAMQQVLNSWITRQEEGKNDVPQGKSIADMKAMMDKYSDEMKRVGEKYFGDVEFQNFSPISLFYYLEREDEVKNPSWKSRKHRFCDNLKMEDVVELNRYFHYADLSYLDDMEAIKNDLANPKHGGKRYDLVHCKMQSEPHEPAFYVAVKRGSAHKKGKCKLLLAIRGTASVEDVITDVLCDSVEYNGGRAHSGILKSGQNLVKEFLQFLDDFIKEVGVEGKIDLLIVGHSLGGGAACIAGYELQSKENLRVRVVGFGTPGVLSKELGEKADYITTVVNDADMIPRTSGETIVNVSLNIMEHDWTEKAKLDADLMLKDVQSKNSWILSQSMRATSMEKINEYLENSVKPTFRPKSTERLEPVLFPPGNCIHLWRNGNGISGSIVPGTFFNEIDIARTMVDDHLCDGGYRASFLQLMRQHHKDPHFRFDSCEDLNVEESK